MKDIAIYGAGGFGREVACLIASINAKAPIWNIIGFFDDGVEVGQTTEYGVVLGGMDVLNNWDKPLAVVMGIGSPNAVNSIRSRIDNENISFPNIISPDAVFLDKDNVRMGLGNVICAGCIISCNIDIGSFNIINLCTTIGHDASMGDCNSIMPNVNISGGVVIGNCNFLGVNSGILQYHKITDNITIGAGAILLRDASEPGVYVGVPAKLKKPAQTTDNQMNNRGGVNY